MLLLRLLILSAEASFPAEPIADPLAQLIALAQYASSLELPTNSLRNHSVPMNTVGGTDHIFVNANLARVLLASARLTTTSPQTSIFLEQGLAWCDTFTELQAHVLSSQGNAAGYWGAGYGEPKSCVPPLRGDCAHGGEIYFGDTGTAVTTLAVCYSMSNRTRQARYMVAMERFATFVLEGSSTTPQPLLEACERSHLALQRVEGLIDVPPIRTRYLFCQRNRIACVFVHRC
jgi:hypothetical protein